MKVLIVLSAVVAVAVCRPSVLLGGHVASVPLAYTKLVPGAPIGLDGRVVDTPEVALAKAEHAAAHINEKITLANEAVKSADVLAYASPVVATGGHLVHQVATGAHLVHPISVAKIVPGAPIGPDGRVVDTPEVALAKAEHAAAHINEKVGLAEEAGKSFGLPVVVSPYSAPVIQKYFV